MKKLIKMNSKNYEQNEKSTRSWEKMKNQQNLKENKRKMYEQSLITKIRNNYEKYTNKPAVVKSEN